MPVAHRIQLLPANKAKTYFAKACGVARFAWNWGVAEWDRQYRAGLKPNAVALKKAFTARIDAEWPWMRETTSYAYQQAFADLGAAYKRFFAKLAKRPRFKKKGRCRDSFYLANTCFKLDGNHVTIQKLGPVRMCESLRYQGKILSARISREANKWFISVCVEVADHEIPVHPSTQTVGVDLGVQTAATLSTGETIVNPRPYKQAQKRLRRQQRALSRALRMNNPEAITSNGAMKKDVRLVISNRCRRLKQRVAKTHQRIVGIRKNMQHQLTASLVKQFTLIAIENLSVKGMTASAKGTAESPGKNVRQKAGLNRSVLDVGFSEIRRQLSYKAAHTGATVVLVDRWAPTSKTCSACGSVQVSMPLSVREWICPDCGAHHDRDRNAAINIRTLGLSTVGATGIDARGPNGSISAGSTVVVTSRVEPRTRLGGVHPACKSASGGHSTTS